MINIFIIIFLIFNILVTIFFGILFFQIPTLKYSTTGCDTQEGKDKIKSSIELYRKLSLVLLIILGVMSLYPIFVFGSNLIAKIFTGFGGSIAKIGISILEIAILITLIIFMLIIYINLGKVVDNPCSDKTKLTDKLDYVYGFVKIIFIISVIISILLFIGMIIYFILKFKNREKVQIDDEAIVESESLIEEQPEVIQ